MTDCTCQAVFVAFNGKTVLPPFYVSVLDLSCNSAPAPITCLLDNDIVDDVVKNAPPVSVLQNIYHLEALECAVMIDVFMHPTYEAFYETIIVDLHLYTQTLCQSEKHHIIH